MDERNPRSQDEDLNEEDIVGRDDDEFEDVDEMDEDDENESVEDIEE